MKLMTVLFAASCLLGSVSALAALSSQENPACTSGAQIMTLGGSCCLGSHPSAAGDQVLCAWDTRVNNQTPNCSLPGEYSWKLGCCDGAHEERVSNDSYICVEDTNR